MAAMLHGQFVGINTDKYVNVATFPWEEFSALTFSTKLTLYGCSVLFASLYVGHGREFQIPLHS
jgi:hypothetical protein